MNFSNDAAAARLISRREAIQRAALLLGVTISPSILAGVLQAQPAGGKGAKPTFLSTAQFDAVGAMAERIIPRTDTPGAIDVGVPAFIDLMYGRYLAADEQRMFAAGLAEIDAKCRATTKGGFSQMEPAMQDSVLTGVADASKDKEKSFFHQLRELTLLGYFTSEPVGKNVTHYDPIPGPFQACIPLASVGNVAWTR